MRATMCTAVDMQMSAASITLVLDQDAEQVKTSRTTLEHERGDVIHMMMTKGP